MIHGETAFLLAEVEGTPRLPHRIRAIAMRTASGHNRGHKVRQTRVGA